MRFLHNAKLRAGFGVFCVAALGGASEAAQETARAPDGLVMSSTLERIVAGAEGDAAGAVAIVPGTVASHADQLVISVRFTNASGQVIDAIRITSPVPADVQYVPQSASAPGGNVLFSVDNGLRFGRPQELTIDTPDGGKRSAEAADYTHVRWVLSAPLDAGATGIVRFRAVPR